MHHLPSLAEVDPLAPEARPSWSRAILPLLEAARVRLLLSGTLERADGRAILWLPYRRGRAAKTREVALEAPGWAVVGYSRAQALAEKAVLPVDFGALDGEAEWLDEERRRLGPHRISGSPEVAGPPCSPRCAPASPATCCGGPSTRPATCGPPGGRASASGRARPRWGSASCWWWRRTRRMPGSYLGWLRGWLPRGQADHAVRIATSDERTRSGAGGLPAAAGALDPGHRRHGL